jgi:hypothetical protein
MSVDEPTIEPTPHHVRPRTLHVIVIALWVAVGVFTGAGLAAVIGAVQLVSDQDLGFWEHVAVTGTHAGPYLAAAAVALGAVAVLESVLVTLGHVRHIEVDLEPAEGEGAAS